MRSFKGVGLGAALILTAAGCSETLQHDLNEEDANEIYVLLTQNGLDAKKDKEGEGKEARYVINVHRAEMAQASQLLKKNSLPRPMASGLAVFKQTKGMIPTQTEERAMYIEALGGEASNALNRIPGVLEARVLPMIPEVTDLTQPELRPKPSASVLLKYISTVSEGATPPPVSVTDVQEFVARSVPELTKDNVKVLMVEVKTNVNKQSVGNVRYLGVQLEKESVAAFQWMVAIPTLIALVALSSLAVVLLRAPSKPSRRANGNGNGRNGEG